MRPAKPRLRLRPKLNAPPFSLDSTQALSLVKAWAWGKKSATQLQKDASDAHADQVDLIREVGASRDFAHKSLQRMANLGTRGTHKSNIKSGLKRALGEPCTPVLVQELDSQAMYGSVQDSVCVDA